MWALPMEQMVVPKWTMVSSEQRPLDSRASSMMFSTIKLEQATRKTRTTMPDVLRFVIVPVCTGLLRNVLVLDLLMLRCMSLFVLLWMVRLIVVGWLWLCRTVERDVRWSDGRFTVFRWA
uniref:Uncharacterized protein n=1 Tax=Anopheles culicifacies TaxID=139723 RepID=A0A182M3L1_9DIPT